MATSPAYINAPNYKYCGEKECSFTSSSSNKQNCVYAHNDREPDLLKCDTGGGGYKFDAWDTDVCSGDTWARRCIKDPDWAGWDPLLAEYNKNPDKVTKATIMAMEKCCSRPGSLDSAGKIKCGSLLDPNNNKTICADIMVDFCLSDEKNLLTPQCKAYINKDTTSTLKNKLRAICPSKIKDANWNDVCSCYYDYNYYDGLAQKIEAVWEGPPGFISRIPECLDPKCAASQYRDTGVTATCPPVSFNKCIQNANFDLGSGDIGKLEFKQECKLGGDGKQIKLKGANAPPAAPAGAGPPSSSTGPPPSGAPPKDNTFFYIAVLLVILLFSGGGGYYYYYMPPSNGTTDNTNNAYYYGGRRFHH